MANNVDDIISSHLDDKIGKPRLCNLITNIQKY